MAGKELSVEIVDPSSGARVVLLDVNGVAITGGNKLLVDGKINDYRRVLNLHHGTQAADPMAAHTVHTVDDRYVIESIREVHDVASDAGGVLTVGVAKGTVTPANSTAQHSTAINLNGTANTVQTAVITTQTTMDAGDRICYKTVTNATNMAGSTVTIVLRRVV